ncbi:methylmalonyl-CoA epimerase [Paenalkalicoccus suaedae]|uniref:Methylmalonyl-CoA epimerase n=1 Tax=Paenalkalicoccus suaedae TaxID=2592382 RepID=A0A859FDR9_9BACI|nr:methylmalonyl-CoA epimerase [Paenalkalicoccus suaedae]QKS70988.1 methylmalonyl-CoA epimerase [Paenalkalicoccus suaedae]
MDKIRVLIAKPGLDGHDRGALVISQALRDAGMEVIYTGLRQSPAQIVQAAIQEDVDVIGLSSLSGAHNVLFPQVIAKLKEQGADDILLIGGGVIPQEDIIQLEQDGIAKIFTPGTSTKLIASYITREIQERRGKEVAPKLAPKGVDHIGIATYSIEETAAFYLNHFALAVEKIVEVPSQGVRVAFIPLSNVTLELLEPLDESSPIHSFLTKRGQGVHHLALQVYSIESRLKELEEEGVKLIDKEPKPGASGHPIAFLHPSTTQGTLIELIERGEGD